MAGKCPQCGASFDHDFGVTPCEKCGTVLFVDFNGEVQVSAPELPSIEDYAGENPFEIPAEDLAILNADAIEKPYQESHQEPYQEPIAETEDTVAETGPADEAAYEWNPDEGVQSGLEAESPSPLSASGLIDFSDVVDFANRGELDNSPLVYRLRIEGIDHKDIRRRVESVLADPKLNFHLKDILPLIKGGMLELHDLSPVKASVIASRLREESVQFYWAQSAFQSGGEEGIPA